MPSVLIIPDKFKGTLEAGAAAEAIARGWGRARPKDTLKLMPMTDGGDGFGEVMSRFLGAQRRCLRTIDAAHRPCKANWWWEPRSKTALIESATVIGLAMLPPKKFHPFELDTFGLGALLRVAAMKGARRCLVGIGGSATNDGGFGLARALGWQFLDGANQLLERWTELERLARIRPPPRRKLFRRLIVAVDVDNSLLGARGATRVYGPQKGLCPADFPGAERSLARLAQVCMRQFGNNYARKPGAGAAGGLGFGLAAFLGACFERGFDLFAETAELEKHLRWAGLVITGEGAIDHSTLMGKGVGRIARLCEKLQIPCVGLAGSVSAGLNSFTALCALTDLTTVARAKKEPAVWLERLAEKAAKKLGDWNNADRGRGRGRERGR